MSAAAEVQRTAAVDLGALLDAGDGAVVTLVAGETRLAAHRAVLAARSPVFRAMFQHDTLEASCGEVRIADVGGPVMRQLLSYVYTLQAPQLTDTAPELLTAADKYGLSALKAACEQQVAAQLEVETAAAAAVLAVRHSCPSLTAAAIHFIRSQTYKVMATQGWADAVLQYPKDIVEVSRLLSEPPAEPSAPAAPAARPPSDSSRTAGGRSCECGGVRPCPACPSLVLHPSFNDKVFRFGVENIWGFSETRQQIQSLSQQERGRRLIEAAKQGAAEQLRELLAAGADVGARGQGCCLVGAGAEVDARTSLEQSTPLHWAARSGHAGVVRLLVGASADPNARDRWGRTPLHIAAMRGDAEAAAELLLAGADRGARNEDGRTPLDLARQEGKQELVDMLTQR
ncbi:ankyrin repeat, PH and SEC7 domain containing protein secG-like [Schistocerca piceifrons]|uniref:ankyrin repeat, PH and SEC7 domain containing protein secG-like n=1 Tax=Schistocerca piceifrons TaxID=274613 RepID=UPI001F5E460A|nr:ankyrin repeat, PH and SEC7 domain containing protein secG-like [Schistocerca piceifrons]